MNWIELKEESDIKDLLERLGYFHDGCLRGKCICGQELM